MHVPQRAFTLAELLVTLGVLSLLASLAAHGLSNARVKSRELGSMSNIRQHGVLVQAYSQSNRDLPPVLFRPEVALYPDGPWQTVEVEGEPVRGSWFENARRYHVLLDRDAVSGIAFDPSRPSHLRVHYRRTGTCDYSIALTFYASRDFWNRWTQSGVSQFVPQRLTSVSFPSQKGFMRQSVVYTIAAFPEGCGACCGHNEPSAVLWADGSATHEAQSALRPGEPNFYHYGNLAPPTYWSSGVPIDATKDGVFGRDK